MTTPAYNKSEIAKHILFVYEKHIANARNSMGTVVSIADVENIRYTVSKARVIYACYARMTGVPYSILGSYYGFTSGRARELAIQGCRHSRNPKYSSKEMIAAILQTFGDRTTTDIPLSSHDIQIQEAIINDLREKLDILRADM